MGPAEAALVEGFHKDIGGVTGTVAHAPVPGAIDTGAGCA
jgi:hypothetical protein